MSGVISPISSSVVTRILAAATVPAGTNAGTNGTRLALGEGYPDYYQSAARTIMPGSSSVSFYVDPDGPTVDLENMRGVSASDRDEGAVAALLMGLCGYDE